MQRRESDQRGGALREHGAIGEQLEGEGEEVEDEEAAELDASDGGLPPVREEDEGGGEEDAERDHDYVGDVRERAVRAGRLDATGGVDAHGRGGGVGRDTLEETAVRSLDLGEVEPSIRRTSTSGSRARTWR